MARLSKEARPDSVGLKAEPALLLTALFGLCLCPTAFWLASFRVGLLPDQAGGSPRLNHKD